MHFFHCFDWNMWLSALRRSLPASWTDLSHGLACLGSPSEEVGSGPARVEVLVLHPVRSVTLRPDLTWPDLRPPAYIYCFPSDDVQRDMSCASLAQSAVAASCFLPGLRPVRPRPVSGDFLSFLLLTSGCVSWPIVPWDWTRYFSQIKSHTNLSNLSF